MAIMTAGEAIHAGTPDLREKPVEYGITGVPAYWTVDLTDGIAVTVHRCDEGVHIPAGTFGPGQRVADPAAPWATVEVTPLLGYYASGHS
ncbi:MAG: hypothetical protein ACFCVF_13260 [Kineosporiaceae bacterium]